MANRVLIVLVVIAAVAGFAFAAVSTSDFVAHLDRQVHGIHCSFLPGVGAPDVTGSSGCHTTLMSPYSSVLRGTIWGGIPVSLPAMAVFAYLALAGISLLILRRTDDPRATGFLALATALPFLTSVVMGFISLYTLGAACKLCIGIYVASTLGLLFASMAFLRARNVASRPIERAGPAPRIARTQRGYAPIALPQEGDADATVREEERAFGHADTVHAAPGRKLATASEMEERVRVERPRAIPVADPAAPVVAYAGGAPEFDRYLGACGTLAQPADPQHVLVALGEQTQGTQVVEILDPLCPACRGFEDRFSSMPAAGQVSRRALLFPLDSECNWMVDRPIHAGACVVSEAVLCADENAEEVLDWAFENQDEIREATEADPGAAARMVNARFPALRSCVGSPEARARLNRGLRWAVANQLPVLTPQVYVGGTRVCDADTDLGLDWTLDRLLDREGGAQ